MSTEASTPTITCPSWCTEDHPGLPGAVHRAPVGAFQRPALHTRRGRLLCPDRGLLQLEIHVSEDDTGRLGEEAITVLSQGVALDLTNGEARRLAALLTGAADRLDGIP